MGRGLSGPRPRIICPGPCARGRGSGGQAVVAIGVQGRGDHMAFVGAVGRGMGVHGYLRGGLGV